MLDLEHISPIRPTLEQVDRFGRVVAEVVYSGWCSGSSAPLWRELFENPDVMAFLAEEDIPNLHPMKEALMRRAAGRGWLVFTNEPRSLRFGPTYLSSTRSKVTVRDPHKIGRYVAYAARGFYRRHDRHPTCRELTYYMRNADGSPFFGTEAEMIKNLPWLSIAGYVTLKGAAVCRVESVEHRVRRDEVVSASEATGGAQSRRRDL